jgi:hypothetical protein
MYLLVYDSLFSLEITDWCRGTVAFRGALIELKDLVFEFSFTFRFKVETVITFWEIDPSGFSAVLGGSLKNELIFVPEKGLI